MAIKLPDLNERFEVVLKIDSAIDSEKCSSDDYNEYLKTGNEGLLHLKEEATRFVMTKTLNYKNAKKIQRAQFSSNDGKPEFDFSSIMEEVRLSLVDIKNPASVPKEDHIEFKQHGEGGASDDLMAKLVAVGAVMDLWTALKNSAVKSDALVKKN